jgi:hypothetical protein
MADETKKPPVVDPDHVPETICDGVFNVHANNHFSTLTFTHVRAKADHTMEFESVVRARIVITNENLIALRNTLNDNIRDTPRATQSAAAGGGIKR